MSGSITAVIPARLGSTRLPEKPLLRKTGKFLIQHVYEQAAQARRIERVIVATDSEKILEAVRSFGGEAEMTSAEHKTGTDRVAEVARRLDLDGVVNVQGDEPQLDPFDLDQVAASVLENDSEIATLAVPIADAGQWADPHTVKVVVDGAFLALYFSRAPIPWAASFDQAKEAGIVYKHTGVYGYPREVLRRFTSLERAPLEELERLEQLRALHHGIPIRVLKARSDSIGIDTIEDYQRFAEELARQARTSS
ncbi:MAG: 3-deoxy-manno-octulosonate cytidylyltransferase [Planctomycetota bacterium]